LLFTIDALAENGTEALMGRIGMDFERMVPVWVFKYEISGKGAAKLEEGGSFLFRP
jgi:hypothetical protein